jgi:hypothetical protein
MSLSLLLTLLAVPVIYTFLDDFGKRTEKVSGCVGVKPEEGSE